MILSVDKRHEIIFLSHHPMGPQLGVKAVAKAKSVQRVLYNIGSTDGKNLKI